MTRRSRTAHQRGFTLIEVMVALGIGMVILLGLTTLFANNSGQQNELERTGRQIENARYATDLIVEDLLHAGFYGEFDPGSLPVATTYVAASACPAAVADLGWTLPVPPAVPQLPMAVLGVPAALQPACLGSRRPATEALLVRRVDTGAGMTPGTLTAGNLYVQVSRCIDPVVDARRVLVGSATADFTLHNPDCTAVNPALRRVVQRAYFVADCNDCAAADGIPTLKRSEWIDGALHVSALAEGIENLQFEYGVDSNGDGQPDSFVAADGITGVAPLVWNNVVTVRIHLLARNTQPTPGYTDPRTYVLGGVVVAPADGYKRTMMTTTVRLNNVGGRREK